MFNFDWINYFNEHFLINFVQIIWSFFLNSWCRRGVMVKAMVCGVVVSVFELQSRYDVHIWVKTFGKGMNPLILPGMY